MGELWEFFGAYIMLARYSKRFKLYWLWPYDGAVSNE